MEGPGKVIQRQMALDHREFLRSLRPLLQGCEWRQRGDRVHIHTADGEVVVTLQPTTVQPLGALRLPRTRVELDLRALDDESAAAFMARFERAFQRGGG